MAIVPSAGKFDPRVSLPSRSVRQKFASMEAEIKAQIPGVDQVISDYAIVHDPQSVFGRLSMLMMIDMFALGLP